MPIRLIEDTLKALNLSDREDQLTMIVARRIVEVAKEGERDPRKLGERTLATIRK